VLLSFKSVSLLISPGPSCTSLAILPSAAVVTKASAEVDIFVARGGIELRATIMNTTLVPSLELSVGTKGSVRACFDLDLVIR
jgi:hypothetical protein